MNAIDIFGVPISLGYKGQRKFKTNLGASLTIIFILIIILTIYDFSYDMLFHINPLIHTTKQ